ncbi:hypothetical protein AB0I34_23680 [Kribbella sp. NPDC050281]|uniref:hypothetical protein n=1 Tax=Kribbella sp. NPDC050281 TaxID=3155515 RepID=UPI0033DE3954
MSAQINAAVPVEPGVRTPIPRRHQELTTRRMNAMRFGYAFMGVGIVVVKWPVLCRTLDRCR